MDLPALQLGAKTPASLPEYCLSAGDFPLTSEEDFDTFGGPPDLKMEKKGKTPTHSRLGSGQRCERPGRFPAFLEKSTTLLFDKAATHLLRLGGAWEELWSRFCEAQILRFVARAEWAALAPATRHVSDDETQYFCTDMLPRMQRQLGRS